MSSSGRGEAARRLLSPQDGQTLVLFALLMNFVFLGVAAIAVDIATQHAERRKLQNAADAAAWAGAEKLKLTGDKDQAEAAAREYALQNQSSSLTLIDLGSKTGSGVGLESGVEASTTTNDVRVALRGTFNGAFSRFVGIPTLTVTARARVALRPPDLLMPTLGKRFDCRERCNREDTDSSKRWVDTMCGAGSTPFHPLPSPRTALGSHCASWATPDSPGPAVPLLGNAAEANQDSGTSSGAYKGWVLPDVRNVDLTIGTDGDTSGDYKRYHGITMPRSNLNGLRTFSRDYVVRNGGYSADAANPLPKQWDSIATFHGAGSDTRDIVAAFQRRYKVGDIVLLMVYDGSIRRNGDGDEYTYVLGYAMFRITSFDGGSNLYAQAVSGLEALPTRFTRTQRPALSTWGS